MKGQYLTIEYVFYFGIGIAMIIIVYFSFFGINATLRDVAIQSQIDRTGELMRTSIVEIFEASSNTDSVIYYNLSIPTKLSGCIYTIRMLDGLNINCTDNYKIGTVLNLYGIDTKCDNIIYSTKGMIKIRAFKNTELDKYMVDLT